MFVAVLMLTNAFHHNEGKAIQRPRLKNIRLLSLYIFV